MRGLLIAFEGLDQSGKQTQAERLKARVEAARRGGGAGGAGRARGGGRRWGRARPPPGRPAAPRGARAPAPPAPPAPNRGRPHAIKVPPLVLTSPTSTIVQSEEQRLNSTHQI